MGNCSKPHKRKHSHAILNRMTSFESPEILFHTIISKLKIREIHDKKLSTHLLSVTFTVGHMICKFKERTCIDEAYKWDEIHKFLYKTNVHEINERFLSIIVASKEENLCTAEISFKSLVDGPIHQNTALIHKNMEVGRISFDIELLQEMMMRISLNYFNFCLEENNVGRFSMSIKFMSDCTIESEHSEVLEVPNWDFKNNKPNLDLSITMKTIRDAALQIRLYKHSRSKNRLTAECWISFTKLFQQDLNKIYRHDSALHHDDQKVNNKEFDALKVKENLNKEYFITINEELWLNGRKIGSVKGEIKIIGMPTFSQILTGVNTEKGVVLQNVNFNRRKSRNNSILPQRMLEIKDLLIKLKEPFHSNNSKLGPSHEREVFKAKKEIIDKICDALKDSKKDSMVCFLYENPKSLMKAQKTLIELAQHLIEFAPLVSYSIKPFYFKCLTFLIIRGELDIGCLLNMTSSTTLSQDQSKIAEDYRSMLHQILALAISRMNFKGIDKITQDFVDKILVISWFRIPEFRETFKTLLKKKSYDTIYEWRKIEIDLDSEKVQEISDPLSWVLFYKLIPPLAKKAYLDSILAEESWRGKMEKRGLAFFTFFCEWLDHIYKQGTSGHILWPAIPGYSVLLKSFLNELKERKIIEYPEALVSCCCKIVYLPRMLNIIVRILFSKTNVYDFNTVQETFKVFDRVFTEYYKHHKKLHMTFDCNFFILGMKIALNDNIAINITRSLWFIYNQYHLIQGVLRKSIVYDVVIRKNLELYFFHWCKELRTAIYYLILYRIFSMKFLNFELGEDSAEVSERIRKKCKNKISGFLTGSERDGPYFKLANKEFMIAREQYKDWKKKLPKDRSKRYGCSDSFPYPLLVIKMNYLDLSERKLEEDW